MLRNPSCLTLVAIGLLFTGCTVSRTPDWVATGASAMVASDHALASQAGAEMLRAGGNAVDAAIAVSLALAVTRPESTGLGGGGFMIVRTADGVVTALDYRETAPAAAQAGMYTAARRADPRGAPPSQCAHLAVATPGLLAGLAEAHHRWGTLGWEKLADPALRAAENGFPVDEHYVDASRSVLKLYQQHPELQARCPYVYRVHTRAGRLAAAGDILRQPELARALRALAAQGPREFLETQLAPALAAEMAARGGLITADDVRGYQVVERAPLRSTYRDCEIIAMPPPSSGGICLIEALNILERLPLPELMRRDPPLAAHYLVEAMKHAFADRARWLGDADFVPVPVELLTSKTYAQTLAEGLGPTGTCPADAYGAVQIPDDSGTSHFSIVDQWGNCVVSTETINTSFGSLAAVEEWGIILNNEMDDFTAEPGAPNFFDLRQSPRNAVAAGKRPLSSMCPTMVLRDGGPVLLIGGSGGPRIISATLNVMLRVVDGGAALPDALAAIRIHHQWHPDEVYFDQAPPPDLAAGLTCRGHQLGTQRRTGVVQAVQAKGRKWVGASDPRKGGRPSGF